jgi:signal transduction histidine kinase
MKEISQVLRGTTDSWFIEKRCVCKDGSVTWVSVNGAVIRDDSGRAIRIMAMIADITARKKVDQQLRDAETELKTRVKKAVVNRARKSASAKTSNKRRVKKR